jgi:membrane protease YdiL (CAAX protease family)
LTPADDGPSGPVDAPGTELVPVADAEGAVTAADDAAALEAGDAPTPSPEPRLAIFSLEGRSVPALYVAAWLGIIIGGGLLFVGVMAVGSAAAPWLFIGGLLLLAAGLIAAAGSQAIERGRRTDLAYRGPSPVLVFLGIVALTPLAQIVVLGPLSSLGLDPRSPAGTAVNLAIQTLLYAAVVRLVVVGTGTLSWGELGVVRPGAAQLRDLLLGAVVAVPVLVLTLLLGGVLSRFVEPSPSPLPDPGSAAGLLLNLVSAAILAPLGEELFFRGFTTTAWAKAAGARPAIVRGAVFFALVHVLTLFDTTFAEGAQRAVYAFVALLPVGLTLGWLFLARRSLYAAIGLHAAFNGIQLLLLALASGLLGSR